MNKAQETKKEMKVTSLDKVAVANMISFYDIDWSKQKEVLIINEPEKKVFVNVKFADNSVFGENCVFLGCKFGEHCLFGSRSEFGSRCEFGKYCKFDFGCEASPHCKFGFGCEFDSDRKKQLPYRDEEGKYADKVAAADTTQAQETKKEMKAISLDLDKVAVANMTKKARNATKGLIDKEMDNFNDDIKACLIKAYLAGRVAGLESSKTIFLKEQEKCWIS